MPQCEFETEVDGTITKCTCKSAGSIVNIQTEDVHSLCEKHISFCLRRMPEMKRMTLGGTNAR